MVLAKPLDIPLHRGLGVFCGLGVFLLHRVQLTQVTKDPQGLARLGSQPFHVDIVAALEVPLRLVEPAAFT